MNELEPSYISKINFKNYKSIRDLTIDLHSGLNLIIGQNSSGKTNFVQAVHNVLSESGHHELPIGFEFGFEWIANNTSVKTKWTGSIQEIVNGKKIRVYKSNLEVGDEKIVKESFFHPDIMSKLPFVEHILVSFALPIELLYLKKMNSFFFNPTEVPDENGIFYLYCNLEDELGYFNSFALKLESHKRFPYGKSVLKKIINNIKVNDELKWHLKRFSPIKDCRLAIGYTIETRGEGFIIKNVILEFFVNNNWYSWEQLSDGTKRLFYIIAQTINNQSFVIIEEPELGLHPDQLFGIMDFLSAQSENKQIIVTTHSPDVLNILEKEELHKIIVTRFDNKKGTWMQHLSPKKMEKAYRYIHTEGLELKDFWLHSNLEELDEAE
ncbi:MAG: hypothetical protein RLZZ628_765 [Bacteroidota bacterium]|jgi:predicted ATPase